MTLINGNVMQKTPKKRKNSKQKQKPAVQQQPPASVAEAANDENPFDFGGLPARDLKKNLGCG